MAERKINEYGSIQFDKVEVVGVAKIESTISLTENDIDNIMVTAIEGGIGYWARLDNTGEDWDAKPKEVAPSQWATSLLLDGESVKFEDIHENDKVLKLTLKKLIKGIELNHKNRPHDNDIENGDSITVDCIVQYALLGENVYG